MKRKTTFAAMAIVLLAAVFLLAHCNAEGEPKKASIVHQVVDSLTAAVVENFVEVAVTETTSMPRTTPGPEPVDLISQITDFVIVEPKLYAVFDGGVIVYDFPGKSHSIIRADEKLQSVAFHEGKVYVGGTHLYRLNDSTLERLEDEYEGVITCLYSHGYRLMIGTECALFSKSIFGRELLLDDVAVSAMAADESGLWVGTAGQGLYRWDGEEFRKRYLLRDSTMFDTVNTLDFKHQHLYVGSTNGLHIFNGGRWKILTTLEGLPANNVKTIDASAWVVYVGTDVGVVSYFNGDFMPVKKLADKKVNVIRLRGRKLIAATDYEGILMKSGNVLKTLVLPVADTNVNILSLISF